MGDIEFPFFGWAPLYHASPAPSTTPRARLNALTAHSEVRVGFARQCVRGGGCNDTNSQILSPQIHVTCGGYHRRTRGASLIAETRACRTGAHTTAACTNQRRPPSATCSDFACCVTRPCVRCAAEPTRFQLRSLLFSRARKPTRRLRVARRILFGTHHTIPFISSTETRTVRVPVYCKSVRTHQL